MKIEIDLSELKDFILTTTKEQNSKLLEQIKELIPVEKEQEYYTLTEAAKKLSLHRMTVYKYTVEEKLPSSKVGGLIKIAHADLQNFINKKAYVIRKARKFKKGVPIKDPVLVKV